MTETNVLERIGKIAEGRGGIDEKRAAIALARSSEIFKVIPSGSIRFGALAIEIVGAGNLGRGAIEIFARAWLDGVQLGFGTDGSVDVERFVVVNPPLFVADANGDIVKSVRDVSGAAARSKRFRFAPTEAITRVIAESVRSSGKTSGIIVPGKTGRTTYTIYSQTADGYVSSESATYANARSGGGDAFLTAETAGADLYVGQVAGFYTVYESFISFDTSTVVGTVSASTLSMYLNTDASSTDFTITAAVRDWGAGLTTADWVAGASLSGLTAVGTLATSGISSAARNDFTSNGNFPGAISVGGTTRLLVFSSRHSGNNQPSGDEYVAFASADTSGTTDDPRLVIEAAATDTWVPRVWLF